MGLKFSKQGAGKVEQLSLQHRLINYLSKSFYIRNLVSKKRRRMLVGGYDLDMSYITDHILAMSFPAQRMRAMYRNPLWQVKSVLDMRHQGHYKIYNLCIEESYDPSHFHGRVESFPFDDNHVPPLEMIKLFCESVSSWLSCNPKNIVVIHCMAGKGRTGLMVCAYLVYCGMSAEDALQLYAQRRTTNNEGVSIPSQRRYVGYWAKTLSFPRGVQYGPPEVKLPEPCRRELQRIRLYDTVNTESAFFVVSELQETEHQVEVRYTICSQVTILSLEVLERILAFLSLHVSHKMTPMTICQVVEACLENFQLSERLKRHCDKLLWDEMSIENTKKLLPKRLHQCAAPKQVPSQLYRPSMELTRKCCRPFKRGYERNNSPRYFLTFVEGEDEEDKSEPEPHLVVQMDTERSALYHKTCLDYNFEKPLPLTGDVRIIFYAKMFGGRLFYACFNTAFITNSLLQLRFQDLDKVGKKGRAICGPSFCLELLFGPANAKHSYPSTSDEDSADDLS